MSTGDSSINRDAPILWSQATYLKAGQIDKWDEQAQFGYRAPASASLANRQ